MEKQNRRCTTGVPGLDEILAGGLPANRLYLLRGNPGVGKTTVAMQFLMEGQRLGEKGLYVTLSETASEIEDIALSHNWDLGKLAIFELSALEQEWAQESQSTIFHPSEIELNKTTDLLLKKIEEAAPRRVVFDSLSELRLLADTPLRYRRQMLALKQYFAGRQITVILLDDHADGEDLQVQSISHGVITIETVSSDYGAERRRIKINKIRGVNFRGGYHDALIEPGGVRIFPRLIAAEHRTKFKTTQLKSGVPQLDSLFGGGIEYGTSCLFLGPAGTGKSSLSLQFALAAADRGEKVLGLLFEETRKTALTRAESIGIHLKKHLASGMIELRQIDPGELTPGQFVNTITSAVEKDKVKVVLIDSLNGYLQAMPDVRFLTIQLHELLTFLSHRGAITFLTVAQSGVLGAGMQAPIDLTYLADSVLLLRYFEHAGQIKKAISILKKRIGKHERSIREIEMGKNGITVGEPMREYQGILTGTPFYGGASNKLSKDK